MKPNLKIVLSIILVSVLSVQSSFAADATSNRSDAVAAYHARFDQQFNEIHARLLDAQSKAIGIASVTDLVNVALKDFAEEIELLSNTLDDPNASVDTAVGYAIEEIGELQWDVSTIETKLYKVKSIKCVKAKKVKTIREVTPKCPKGFSLKK